MKRLPHALEGLTISIVSHGHEVWIEPLLHKLASTPEVLEWVKHVVLTHNLAPAADWADRLGGLDWPFKLTEIYVDRPQGFATNHNQAFSYVCTRWFAVLNPDITQFSSGIWNSLLSPLQQSRVGLTYPQLLNTDGSLQDNHRALLTPWALWLRYGWPTRAKSTPRVDWVSGAFMVFSSEAYEEIGGFDSGFPLYCEDADLCVRLQLAGWQLSGPHGHATHAAQRSSHTNWRRTGQHLYGLARFWCKMDFWRYWWHRLIQER